MRALRRKEFNMHGSICVDSSVIHKRSVVLPRYASISSVHNNNNQINEHHLCSCTTSDHWWNFIVLRTFKPQHWIENFRMSRYLCQRLYPILNKMNIVMRRSISVQQQVAISLWCLATPTEYRTIAHLFGVAFVR